MNWRKVYLIHLLPVMSLLVGLGGGTAFAQNIDPLNDGSKYAYGENIGWINFNPSQGPGVTVDDTTVSGYAWGENIGWINLSPANGGVLNDGTGRLSGYAWGENVGWINFAPTGGGVTVDTCGDFNGLARSENVGWISFRSDGAVPFKVSTSWVSPLDTVAPVTTVSGPGIDLSAWNNIDANLTLSTTDCGTGAQEVHYSLDGGPDVVTAADSAMLDITADGIYSLSYYSLDGAGNVEAAQTATIKIDKTPPVVALTSPADGTNYTLHSGDTAAFTADDALSGIVSVISTAPNGSDITTTAGQQTFTVSATDAAGNNTTVTHVYTVVYAGNIDPANAGAQYAWGENVGWINFKPSYGPGVTVTDGAVSGMAWGENIGWINLSPANGGGVTNDGAGHLSGYAWGENVGWINFAPTGGGVTIDPATGTFSGYAWGENIGWINFAPTSGGIVTAWRQNSSYTLSLTTAGTGSGTVTGAGTYTAGQTATVTATADAGSTFDGWSGADATECDTGSVLMDADKSCTATFTLVDNPPVANAGPDQTVEATASSGASTTLDGSGSSDPDGNPLAYSWTGPFGTASGVSPTVTLPLGASSVTLTVSDGTLTASDSVLITVQDTTAPVIAPHDDVTVDATSSAGAIVTYDYPTTTDAVDGTGTATCVPASGSTFAVGDTTVTCNATDSSGNNATPTSFVVTVQAVIVSIAVTPADPTIVVGQTQAFTAMGTFSDGSTQVLNPHVTAIGAGNVHSCELVYGGQVQCWGSNLYGQLGDGTASTAYTPVMVSGLSGAAAIAVGHYHTCALVAGGQVQCWGNNGSGQLGDGTNSGPELCSFVNPCSTTPVTVSGLSGATAIAAGELHTCALLGDGTVQCWGYNGYGQLGDGTNTSSFTPVAVSGLSGATAIAAGEQHTCALLGDGTVQCWGYNGYRQLGDGTATDAYIPVMVSGLSGATAIAAGGWHSCALLGDGTVQCWGWNSYGQLGDNSTTDASTPVMVSGLSGATAIAAGEHHTCALMADGQEQCWGDNSLGQLGDGTSSGPEFCDNGYFSCSTTPVTVSGLSGLTAIAAGGWHNCALLGDGTVQCWGDNDSGQLGDGTTTASSTPVTVNGLSSVVWTSSDPTIATIDASGTATGLSTGTATITATYGGVSGSTTLSVAAPTPTDLVVSALTPTPSRAAVGQTVTLTATISNNGPATAYNFRVDLYRNLSSPPAVGQTGDASCQISSLAPNETTTCSTEVSYEAVGTYYVWAQVDTMNTVPETYETNNTNHAGLAVKLPDLRVIQLSVPSANVTVGQQVTLTAVVENVSAVDVIHPFEVDIYKDLSSAPGVGQLGDMTCDVDYLASLATTTCTATVTYAATGTFNVWAQADTQNSVGEAYENNNLKGPANVTVAYPDLVISALRTSTSSASVGQSVTLIAYAHNGGGYAATSPFSIDIYQDSPTAPTPTQVGDVTCTANSLAAGGTTYCRGTVTYDAPGTYQVWAQVDRTDADVESDETNNVGGPVTVTIH